MRRGMRTCRSLGPGGRKTFGAQPAQELIAKEGEEVLRGDEARCAEQAPASAEPAAGSASKRGTWIAAGVAAAIVLGAGLLYALYGSPAKRHKTLVQRRL